MVVLQVSIFSPNDTILAQEDIHLALLSIDFSPPPLTDLYKFRSFPLFLALVLLTLMIQLLVSKTVTVSLVRGRKNLADRIDVVVPTMTMISSPAWFLESFTSIRHSHVFEMLTWKYGSCHNDCWPVIFQK